MTDTHTHAHITGMHGPVMLQGHSSCLSRPWTTVTSVRFAISKSTRQVLRSHSLKKRSELKDLRSKKYILKNKTNIDIFILIYILKYILIFFIYIIYLILVNHFTRTNELKKEQFTDCNQWSQFKKNIYLVKYTHIILYIYLFLMDILIFTS